MAFINLTKKLIVWGAIVFLMVGCCGTQSDNGRLDKQTEQRIDELISQMTLEEKIGQTNQLSSYGTAEAMSDVISTGMVGSILNEVNPVTINAMQRIAVEQSRLGIPLLIARDVIHGFRTIFPIPLGLASTFDVELVERGGRIAALEATSHGVRWTFSPMLDISRDARWGRIAESSGEDTYLNMVMGAALVRGYQGDGDYDPTCMAACAKHFVGYGAAEGGRDYNSTNIPERQLRNVYLPPFEAAIKSGAMTLMTSFNDNDGIPSTGNRHLLEDILHGEWDFGGVIVTDWNSAGEMIAHGFAADNKDAARIAINAGVDIDMMSYTFTNHLAELIAEGEVDQARLDDAVRSILRLKFRLGLFDNPYVDIDAAQMSCYTEESLDAAYQTALKSAVLLQNNNSTLPLDAERISTILVTGPLADAPYEQLGTWAFDGEPAHTVTPLAALRQYYGDKVRIIYEPALTYSREKVTPSQLAAVTAKARMADAVLVFVGEEAILSGEAHCLADLNLQGSQSDLIAAARRSGKPVITTVIAGRPLTIGDDLKNSDALLYSFHPGTMGGKALADLIFGKESPSGKLPATFPVTVGQIPMHYNHNMTGRPANGSEILLDDIVIGAGQTSLGCTSYMLDAGFYPLFPFGYGLSYTTFEYGTPTLDKSNYSADETIRATCTLTNSGKVDATEVVQLYVRDLVGSVTRPVKELKGFRRVRVGKGESVEVTFELPASELAFWNIDMERTVESGEFQLWISGDSATGKAVTFNVI